MEGYHFVVLFLKIKCTINLISYVHAFLLLKIIIIFCAPVSCTKYFPNFIVTLWKNKLTTQSE